MYIFIFFKLNKENPIKTKTTDHSNNNKKTKSDSFDSLNKQEKLNLITIGLKYGKKSFISMNFKKYFKNRSRLNLYKIFDCLQKNPKKLERFKKKVKSMKDLKVLNYQEEENVTRSIETVNNENTSDISIKTNNFSKPWLKDEILNLVYLEQKLSGKFSIITKEYKNYFNNRSRKSLSQKFHRIKKKVLTDENFKEVLNEVKLMKELKIINFNKEDINVVKSVQQIESSHDNEVESMEDSIVLKSQQEDNNVLNNSKTQFKETSKKMMKQAWTKNEIHNLVFLVNNYGYEWSMFLKNYPQFFHHRKPWHLQIKYEQLKKLNFILKKSLKKSDL